MILNLKLPNVSGNCQHQICQGNAKNLTVTLCMTQNRRGGPLCHKHTKSIGTPPPQLLPSWTSGSSTEPAESSDENDDIPHTPPKPKCRPRRPRKLKQIVVKEKTCRICCGSRHTQKQCSLCNDQFP